uniref:hypothetical protein n=1 Tax=Flavobacterium sp. TaxID=239 RepID=UPI0040492E2B
MKFIIIVLGFLFTSSFMTAQHSIEGIWDTGKENTTIEIKNGAGKIYSSNSSQATEGKLMIKDLKKEQKEYTGKLFIIRKNKWVDAVFVPNGNALTITVSVGLQSKTLKWNLVKKS